MNIPSNLTEQEILKTIEKVIRKVAAKFRFGYHDIEDMKQHARIFALDGLKRYDNTRPLENFLWTHVRNRLFNFKRDNYERPDRPCFSCEYYNEDLRCECEIFDDKSECLAYHCWYTRNSAKKNLIKPIELNHVNDEHEYHMYILDDVIDNVILNEIKEYLDKSIPVTLRADYVKLKYGIRLPKYRRLQIEEEVIRIIREYNYGKKEKRSPQ